MKILGRLIDRMIWWRRPAVRADTEKRDAKANAVAGHVHHVASKIEERADEYRRAQEAISRGGHC